jgi:PcrA/UvrD helicase-like protein
VRLSRRFEVGAKVYNSQLGAGEVLSVDGYGDKEKLTINFENSGVRQILSKFFILETFDNELHAPPPAAEPTPGHGSDQEGTGESVASPPASPVRAAAPAGRQEETPRPQAPAPPGEAQRSEIVGRSYPAAATATTGSIKEALREVLREEMGAPHIKMIDRFKGGTMTLRPGRAGLAEKAIPIDGFFHKIVMVRDRLRVLEQKINAHTGLSDADKIDLQQYITRIYGSLTTFNVLFADRDDWFVGQKDEGE